MVLTPDAARLDGRVAAVTGAAAGIGRACARALAAYGADLAACDRDGPGLAGLADEVAATGRAVVTHVCDVRDVEGVAGFVAAVRERWTGVDVLVNNAGGTFRAAFADATPKGDDALVRENLLSVVWVTRLLLPLLRAGASVVNVTSVEAHRASPNFAVYGAAKAGVEQLTKTLALELAPRGVRVNAVAPDVVSTPGVGALDAAAVPLGRTGDPDDIAGVVVFLASAMSSFVTGASIAVDGGTGAARGWRRSPEGEWVT